MAHCQTLSILQKMKLLADCCWKKVENTYCQVQCYILYTYFFCYRSIHQWYFNFHAVWTNSLWRFEQIEIQWYFGLERSATRYPFKIESSHLRCQVQISEWIATKLDIRAIIVCRFKNLPSTNLTILLYYLKTRNYYNNNKCK